MSVIRPFCRPLHSLLGKRCFPLIDLAAHIIESIADRINDTLDTNPGAFIKSSDLRRDPQSTDRNRHPSIMHTP